MSGFVKVYDHELRTANGQQSVALEDLGGESLITRTSAPAQEDMPDPSAALWIDVSLNRLMVAFHVEGVYDSVVVVPFDEV